MDDRLEELEYDLSEMEAKKTAIKTKFMETLAEHSEYAGYTKEEASDIMDDILDDMFDLRDLKQEIEELGQSIAARDLEDLRRDYYASVL